MLTREQKQKIVEELKEKISKQKAIIFVDFAGLRVKDMFDLRKKLKTGDGELKVVKKTLIHLALKESKLKMEVKELEGEIALVFGYKEEISLSKIVWQFSEANPNLKILGGFFENKLVKAEKIIELAKLPTKEELLGRVVGSISAPISNFVNALEGNLKGLIYVLSRLEAE